MQDQMTTGDSLRDRKSLSVSSQPIGIPVSVYMLRSALAALPKEVEEAAMRDGRNRIAVVRRTVLPLLRLTRSSRSPIKIKIVISNGPWSHWPGHQPPPAGRTAD
jgi:hypothetical protein